MKKSAGKTQVKKAVILAAGLGTRFLPVTKSMPKEMLPIIDTPVIHYVVKEAVESGIDDILIITGRGKRAVEDYFDASPELEDFLKRHNKTHALRMIQHISSMADIHYIRQKEPLGLGDAVLHAERHIGSEPFAVLLGDDIIKNHHPCTRQLIRIFTKHHCPVIAVQQILPQNVNKYGMIKAKKIEDGLFSVEDIIEKPSIGTSPSYLGTVGRYILTSDIFDCIKKTQPGVGNEIQLTDAIRLLRKNRSILAYSFKGKRYDTGDRFGYIQAILDTALETPGINKELFEYLKSRRLTFVKQ
jgi:UTP--glucose-1-phosphate uridylyltransferase